MPRVKKNIKIISLIVSIIVLSYVSVFDFVGVYIYYGSIIFALAFLLITGRKPRFNFLPLWLCFIGLFSIIINDIPGFINPYQRLFTFCTILALAGPLLKTNRLSQFKLQFLKTLNVLIVMLVIFSFIGLLIDFPIVNGQSGFNGFFNHSMLLGPIAAIGTITCLNWGRNEIKKKSRIIYFILAAISITTCIAAGSRSALFAGLLAIVYYFYKTNQNNLKKFLGIIILLTGFGILTYSLWEPFTTHLSIKMERTAQSDNLAGQRGSLWERRLSEFSSSPFYGIGFANDSRLSENDIFIGEGRIEPGSSWLVVLSMLGILGFVPFLILYGSFFYFVLKSKKYPSTLPYLGALMVFFAVHMVAEGYIFAAGSGTSVYFWLIFGVISVYQQENLSKKTSSGLRFVWYGF